MGITGLCFTTFQGLLGPIISLWSLTRQSNLKLNHQFHRRFCFWSIFPPSVLHILARLMDFSLWDHGLTFVCWQEEFWHFYTREVADLLSNTAGVRADLVGSGKVIDCKATVKNTDKSKAGISRTTPLLITGTSQRWTNTVITASIVMSNEPHSHVTTRWVQLWVATLSMFLLNCYCVRKSDKNRVIFNNQCIQLKIDISWTFLCNNLLNINNLPQNVSNTFAGTED